jgi:aryl-alcohol dehydrogenase-like predicted oxidoreductase
MIDLTTPTPKTAMNKIQLGLSDLRVSPICLGTMTFGEQVHEPDAHSIMSAALDSGIDFFDTAEMYAVPPSAETYGATERFIGNWLAKTPGARQKITLATKVAGPARYNWIRGGAPFTAQGIIEACNESLKRLQTDVIDLYQIHWAARQVPAFGNLYYDPAKEDMSRVAPIEEQLRAMETLHKAGKVRAFGLSNESPYGVMEFVRLAGQHGLPRIATVQNPYCLINRAVENGLDEVMHRSNVSLLAYSPLGFGLLTGKYDATGLAVDGSVGRMAKYESMRAQRWGRAEALTAARRYNALARDNGMTPAQMALAFCYTKWQVASTIIGVTTLAHLQDNVAAWGTQLSPEVLQAIDAIRWENRDPAQ